MGNRKPQVRISTLSRCLMLSLAVMAGGMVPLMDTYAQSPPPAASVVEFNIPAGELAAALDRFAEQSGLQVVSDQSLQGVKAKALRGRYAPEEALRRLLQGSGFGYERLNAQTLVLKKQPVGARPEPKARSRNAPTTPQAAEPATQDLDNVTVTGTRIRGGETPSPVITIDADQISEEGFNDLGEVIRSVTQNYNGGQNPGVTNGQVGSISNANFSGGSSLNLRGLGPDGSLTLLNGRRLPYGGPYQSVDLGAIPVEAVQRIEIVADGASAIYGSDAVGGVGNVILKRDFEGLRLGARYGAAIDGGLATREYSSTNGLAWQSGGVIATLKDVSVDPIYADQRDYTQFMGDPSTIYPGSDTRSGLISAFQGIGGFAELRLDAFASERKQRSEAALPMFAADVRNTTDTSFVSPSLEFFLARDWTLTAGASWGNDEIYQQAIWSYPDGTSALMSDMSYSNDNKTYDLGAEGPIKSIGGGDVRLAVGVGYRTNGFRQFNHLTQVARTDADTSSRFAYAEINLPLIADSNRRKYAHRLSLTAAVRGEDYDSFGRVSTPKLGVIYSPSSDITLKASWGKSFKAPILEQLYGLRTSYLDPASAYATGFPAGATVLETTGSNPDLEPERANSWTVSLALHPEAIPGLDAQLSLFDINFTGKVLSPINSPDALLNPVYWPFIIFSPTPEQQAAAIASTQFINSSGAEYDPAAVVALIDRRQKNVSRQHIRGVDLSAGYGFAVWDGRLTMRGSASLLDSEQQTLANQDAFDLSGRIFHPARYKGRFGLVWNRGGFTATGFTNYTSGVFDTVAAENTGSFTTLDATLRYRIDEGDAFWSSMDLSLTATNLLNRAPPGYMSASLTSVHFDSTNYSAIGRFVNVSISKHF